MKKHSMTEPKPFIWGQYKDENGVWQPMKIRNDGTGLPYASDSDEPEQVAKKPKSSKEREDAQIAEKPKPSEERENQRMNRQGAKAAARSETAETEKTEDKVDISNISNKCNEKVENEVKIEKPVAIENLKRMKARALREQCKS